MPKKPPIDEIEFLRRVRNHGELLRNMHELALPVPDLSEYVHHIAGCWFGLSAEHLGEAQNLQQAGCPRAALSRAYYVAYNASKAVRYLVYGVVSLKADDHKLAPQLPDDFPQPDVWAERITRLYANRLLADYDNWSSTSTSYTLTPDDAIKIASDFLVEARNYVSSKYGVAL